MSLFCISAARPSENVYFIVVVRRLDLNWMKYCWLAMGRNQARRRMIEEGKTFYKTDDGITLSLTLLFWHCFRARKSLHSPLRINWWILSNVFSEFEISQPSTSSGESLITRKRYPAAFSTIALFDHSGMIFLSQRKESFRVHFRWEIWNRLSTTINNILLPGLDERFRFRRVVDLPVKRKVFDKNSSVIF